MKRAFLVLLLTLSFLSSALLGAEMSTEPLLQIETGTHTGIIRHIAADAAGRFLVTGSYDKTVRVWDLATGKLFRTIRPPTQLDNPVQAYSVTISPDGETVAVGGGTARPSEPTPIYLFSRSTGFLLRRIQVWQVSSTIDYLVFSPDSRHLAVALDTGTIGIVKSPEGIDLGWDYSCKSSINGLDFSSLGRLATSCGDGILRLYDSNLKELAKVSTSGKQPWGVRFSYDGKMVAVGHHDYARVDVFSGDDLKQISGAVDDKNKGALFEVAWTQTGSELCALRNNRDASVQITIRCWPDISLKDPRDFLIGTAHSLFDLAPLPGRRLAFSTENSGWGVLNVTNGLGIQRADQGNDFQGIGLNFRLSQTGSRIQFKQASNDETLTTFSVEDRSLNSSYTADLNLAPPRTQVIGLRVTGWEDTYEVYLGFKKLKLSPGDRSQSIALDPDGNFFFLGTHRHIYSYNDSGNELWKISAPGSVWALNISRNRQLLVAAFSDGTIRWFRADNGQELLAFFPHTDRKRWVAWTPSGYYDTSIDGEELMGWHVNRGPDETADWFPASQFRDHYYRPDVISQILVTRDEFKTLAESDAKRQTLVKSPGPRDPSKSAQMPSAEADQEKQQQPSQQSTFNQLLPPVVTSLISTGEVETRETFITIPVAVRSPSGEPVTSVRAFVDGRPVSPSRGLTFEPTNSSPKLGATETYEIVVPIPSRDCTVTILAETRFATSELLPVKVRWIASPPVPEKPALYMLAVGVGTYRNPNFNLDLPAKDARDLAAAWKRQEGGLYEKTEIRLLTDKDATRDAILSGLEWLETQVTQKDVAVLFFAGHGVNDPRSGGYQFLPYEADLNARRTTLLPDREVISTLAGLPGKALVFLDTCYSGNLLGGLKTRDASDLTGLINELASTDKGVVVFAASTGRQLSAESPEWKNGVFTKAVVEALNGKADLDGNRSIWITEIESYVGKRLKELTGGLQTPVSHKPGGVPDFPVAMTARP